MKILTFGSLLGKAILGICLGIQGIVYMLSPTFQFQSHIALLALGVSALLLDSAIQPLNKRLSK